MPAQKENIFLIVLITALLLATITAYFIWTFLKQHKKVIAWQQARIKAEIETLENERKRIAADLHDELGPMLSAVKLQINHLEPTDETETIALNKSSNQIDEIIQRFRDISYDLLPNTLVRKGLVKAVEEFIGKLQGVHQIKIIFNSDKLSLTQEKEINIYRIIQEIIHNTIKHSRASQLSILIKNYKEEIILKTDDDGVGFNYAEKVQVGSGLGLLNLQSRAEVLNGQLKIISQPGKGTIFIIEIPN